MIELSLLDVRWSTEHGHPVLILRASGQTAEQLAIVISTSDAQLLAAKPSSASLERLRLFTLVEATTDLFGAKLADVHLRLDSRMVLTGDLHYVADDRAYTLSANFADALVLAKRAGIPMLIGEHDLAAILARQPQTGATADALSDVGDTTLGRALTAFIESLQIDDFSGPSCHAD